MTPPYFKLDAHELLEGDTHIRRMSRELAQLTGRYGAITGGRFGLAKSGTDAFEAHLELLLPQHQIILNAACGTPEAAVRDVIARALAQLALLERRDPRVRPRPEAKAA